VPGVRGEEPRRVAPDALDFRRERRKVLPALGPLRAHDGLEEPHDLCGIPSAVLQGGYPFEFFEVLAPLVASVLAEPRFPKRPAGSKAPRSSPTPGERDFFKTSFRGNTHR